MQQILDVIHIFIMFVCFFIHFKYSIIFSSQIVYHLLHYYCSLVVSTHFAFGIYFNYIFTDKYWPRKTCKKRRIYYFQNLKKDGNNPCMLYGYGGFNVSLLPYFGVSKIVFMDNMNGVYAIPNIRGGG